MFEMWNNKVMKLAAKKCYQLDFRDERECYKEKLPEGSEPWVGRKQMSPCEKILGFYCV